MKITKIVLDTNILLSNPNFIKENLSEDKLFVVPLVVLRELSNQKSRGSDISWKSRKVLKALCALKKDEYSLDRSCSEIYSDPHMTNDEKIVEVARKIGATVYSQDKDVIIYCEGSGVPVRTLTPKEIMSIDKDFKGIKWMDMDTATIEDKIKVASIAKASVKNGVEDPFDLYPNEFMVLITHDQKGKKKFTYYRKKKGLLFGVIPYKTADLSAKNAEQVCALDILMDPDVPVSIVTGVAGSGKTYLATNGVLKPLMSGGDMTGTTNKVMFLRNPDGSSI